ncbi:MAG: MbnP family protein [Bacteroidota bacterium]
MKRIYTLLLAISMAFSGFAQTEVSLRLDHFLGTEAFSFNESVSNNLDVEFEVTRMQYYLSEFTLVHDGGQEIALDELFILVNAEEAVDVVLGDFPITEFEAIKFHVGVGPDFNFLDPATYAMGDPLGFVQPSMHWSWTAGYRYVAYEGNVGSNFEFIFQLHGGGTDNFFETEVAYPATAADGAIAIKLAGDYLRLMDDIDVTGGVISHGITGDAKKALENMRDFVFTVNDNSTSVSELAVDLTWDVFPNPSLDGQFTVQWESPSINRVDLQVFDVLGQRVLFTPGLAAGDQTTLQLDRTGTYFVQLSNEGKTVATQMVQVQ